MSDFLVSDEAMQKLADADSVLADLVMAGMLEETEIEPEVMNLIMTTGLGLYEFQHELVERGLAREVFDRSDREAVEADV